MNDTSWVSADGGAVDRVAVLCAVLLGVCAVVMIGTTIVREAWVAVGFWTVVLGLSLVVGRASLRRIRGAGQEDDA